MRDGFISVACGTPKLRLADCHYNAEQTFTMMRQAEKAGVKLLVLPELGLTGYSCGDLFYQETLLRGAEEALTTVLEATRNLEVVTAVGMPLQKDNKLYNCAVIIQKGQVLGVVPKTHLPNYSEFYEKRQFAAAPAENTTVTLLGKSVPFGNKLVFRCAELPELVLGFEICEDMWAPVSPSVTLAVSGATIIGNLSASNDIIGKDAVSWCPCSLQSSCAAMSIPVPVRESPPPMWCLAAIKSLRKTARFCRRAALKTACVPPKSMCRRCVTSAAGPRCSTRLPLFGRSPSP